MYTNPDIHIFLDWDCTITNWQGNTSHLYHDPSHFWEPWILRELVIISQTVGVPVSIGTHGGHEDPKKDTARTRIIKSLNEVHMLSDDYIAPIAITTGKGPNKQRHLEESFDFHGIKPKHNNDTSLNRYGVKTIFTDDDVTNTSHAIRQGALGILPKVDTVDSETIIGLNNAHLLLLLEILKSPNRLKAAEFLIPAYMKKYRFEHVLDLGNTPHLG